jgi:hypothetical protein
LVREIADQSVRVAAPGDAGIEHAGRRLLGEQPRGARTSRLRRLKRDARRQLAPREAVGGGRELWVI